MSDWRCESVSPVLCAEAAAEMSSEETELSKASLLFVYFLSNNAIDLLIDFTKCN